MGYITPIFKIFKKLLFLGETYDNDILTSNEDFVVASIEIFTFLD